MDGVISMDLAEKVSDELGLFLLNLQAKSNIKETIEAATGRRIKNFIKFLITFLLNGIRK